MNNPTVTGPKLGNMGSKGLSHNVIVMSFYKVELEYRRTCNNILRMFTFTERMDF